jgi:kynurenine formamidase
MHSSRLSSPVERGRAVAAALGAFVLATTAASLTGGATSTLAANPALDPARVQFVDLTHPFNVKTLYWPSASSGFTYSTLTRGRTPGGYFYSAGVFQAPEHGGTHMDAPAHFKEEGQTAADVPLERLVAPVVVIDVSTLASGSPDYEVTATDVASFEARHGPIARGTTVLVRTGWSSRWPDRLAYYGDDTPHDTSNLHFPGFGEEAMRLLVEQRGVAAVGIDTASLDPGRSNDFRAHRIAAGGGVPGFENLTNLEQVPAKGAWLLALPMKIEGGTGGPLRAVAMIPNGR